MLNDLNLMIGAVAGVVLMVAIPKIFKRDPCYWVPKAHDEISADVISRLGLHVLGRYEVRTWIESSNWQYQWMKDGSLKCWWTCPEDQYI